MTENGSFWAKKGRVGRVNFNLYHYAGNSPIKYTDPDGRAVFSVGVFGSAGAGVGGAVSVGFSIGYSFEDGLTVGIWSSESIGAEFSADASAGISFGIDPYATSVETGTSQTMTIGASADLGYSFGGDYTLDIDNKVSSLSICRSTGKSAANGKYSLKTGVGASATAIEGHVRYNLTQTRAVNVGEKMSEFKEFLENTDIVQSCASKLKSFENRLLNEIMGY